MRNACYALAFALVMSGCQRAPQTMGAEHARALEDSLLAVLEDLRSATNRGDWDAALALYSRDARFHWVEDGRTRYTSAEAVGAGYAELEPLFDTAEIEWVDPRVVALAPGVGAVTTSYRQVLTNAERGDFPLQGAISFTAVHASEGWRLLLGHSSTLRNR